MKKQISVSLLIGLLTVISGTAYAAATPVPEIDGGMAVIAIGLTAPEEVTTIMAFTILCDGMPNCYSLCILSAVLRDR